MEIRYSEFQSGNGVMKAFDLLVALRWDIDTLDQIEKETAIVKRAGEEFKKLTSDLMQRYANVDSEGKLDFDTEMKKNKFYDRLAPLRERTFSVEKIQVSKDKMREHGILLSCDEYDILKKVVNFV